MKYRKKPTTIDAIQWFKDVNSGKDFKIKSYAERDPLDNRVCEQCRHPMKDHGFLDRFRYGQLVCPGFENSSCNKNYISHIESFEK